MNLLYVCGREITYSRNTILYRALARNTRVIKLTSQKKTYLGRYLEIIIKFLLFREKYDRIFIGFYGQPLVLFFKLFTTKPIIFDAFISTYQTLCFDRQKCSAHSLFGRIAFWLDKTSCSLADTVLLDTNSHINYFTRTFNLDQSKFKRIFVGADEKIFFPRPKKPNKNSPGRVLFYGEYQPLHGIESIVKAAKLLEKMPVKFKLIGQGSQRKKINDLAKSLKLNNVQFVDWVAYNKLPAEIAAADLVIGGHLGTTHKARLVIPGKLFQAIAMSAPTIVARNKANQELFLSDAPYVVDPGNHGQLAKTILNLLDDRKNLQRIALNQFEIYRQFASQEVISQEIGIILNRLG